MLAIKYIFSAFLLLIFFVQQGFADINTSVETKDYEIFYNIFDSSTLQPKTAAYYDFIRAPNRKLINISIRAKNTDGSTSAKAAVVKGTMGDLIQTMDLKFKTIKETGAIYYIAPFIISNSTTYQFKITVQPDLDKPEIPINFSRQLFTDEK